MCLWWTWIIGKYYFLKSDILHNSYRLYNSSHLQRDITCTECTHGTMSMLAEEVWHTIFNPPLWISCLSSLYSFPCLSAYSLTWFLGTLYILIIEPFALWIANVPFQAAICLRIFLCTIFMCGWKMHSNNTHIVPRKSVLHSSTEVLCIHPFTYNHCWVYRGHLLICVIGPLTVPIVNF